MWVGAACFQAACTWVWFKWKTVVQTKPTLSSIKCYLDWCTRYHVPDTGQTHARFPVEGAKRQQGGPHKRRMPQYVGFPLTINSNLFSFYQLAFANWCRIFPMNLWFASRITEALIEKTSWKRHVYTCTCTLCITCRSIYVFQCVCLSRM